MSDLKNKPTKVVITGNFDGCHLGHQSLFIQLKQYAKSNSLFPMVLSFDQHTRTVITKKSVKLLSPSFEKKQWFKSYGLALEYLDFETNIKLLTAKEFVRKVLIDCYSASAWIVGFNHRFGKDLQILDKEFLEWASAQGLKIIPGKELEVEGGKVSSTLLRQLLDEGNVKKVNSLLGRAYSVIGEVVPGDQIGRTIDFPTANLKFELNKKLPSPGVYGGYVQILGKRYKAMTHLGGRPTLNESELRLEVYVVSYSGDLYGQMLCFKLSQKIREILKFDNLESLAEQLKKDEAFWINSKA